MRTIVTTLFAALILSGCTMPGWPVEGTLTSPFGLRHRGLLDIGIHRGVDISVPTGTPVRAMAPGQVEFAGAMSGYGYAI
ncbi:MAG TPA: M23 family metallopeptidase, partial [Longimicrobiales bacterium]|nr:M23 family metallopeptidase [Longimicrobiales bacterium]